MASPGPGGRLAPGELARALRLSLWEGRFWGLMVGFGETYFLADAVRHEASPTQLALVVTLPLFAGATGPLIALRLLSRASWRRPTVVFAAGVQTAVFASLATAELLGWVTPTLLIALVCVYQVAAMASSTLWSSWYADLVPAEMRGRYFARRNRGNQLGLFIGLAGAGGVLHLYGATTGISAAPRAQALGFATIFILAALMRAISAALLARSPENRFRGLASPARGMRFLRSGRGRAGLRVLLIGGSVQLATYLASPFFTPFMLDHLRFTYLEFMLASAVVVATKVALFPAFGHQIDAHGATPVYRTAVIMVALIPVPWFFADGLPLVLCAQALSGMAWACYEVSFFSVLVESSFRQVRPYLFAAQNVVNGSAQLTGSLLGAALLSPPGISLGGTLQWLFAISCGARLLTALCLLPLLPRPSPEQRAEPHHLVLRAIGFRTAGGVVHRPVELLAEEPSDDTFEDGLAGDGVDGTGSP